MSLGSQLLHTNFIRISAVAHKFHEDVRCRRLGCGFSFRFQLLHTNFKLSAASCAATSQLCRHSVQTQPSRETGCVCIVSCAVECRNGLTRSVLLSADNFAMAPLSQNWARRRATSIRRPTACWPRSLGSLRQVLQWSHRKDSAIAHCMRT